MKKIPPKMFTLFIVMHSIFLFVLLQSAVMASEKFYTAQNIWYEPGKETGLWCINYKTGLIIPAGTEVTKVTLTQAKSGRYSGAQAMALYFKTVNDGKEYLVNFVQKFHPQKTIQDYKDLMFSKKTFAQLTQGLSSDEVEAIKEGKIIVGMSKEAVLISYGHPPEHRTPSLDNNQWHYWMNRFRSKAINFDEHGKTTFPPPKKKNEL